MRRLGSTHVLFAQHFLSLPVPILSPVHCVAVRMHTWRNVVRRVTDHHRALSYVYFRETVAENSATTTDNNFNSIETPRLRDSTLSSIASSKMDSG